MSDKATMEKGVAWVIINDLKDTVRVVDITPAEAIILRKQFGVLVEGETVPLSPVKHLDIQGTVAREANEEFQRLTRKYGKKMMSEVFPGEAPNIPTTFKAVGLEDTVDGTGKEPKKGKELVVVPLADIKREDGSDLEPATARLAGASRVEQTALIALVEKLQSQVDALTKSQASAEVTNKTPAGPTTPPAGAGEDDDN